MKKLLALSLICLGYFSSLRGQSDMLLYNFNSLGQSIYTNPAMPQDNRLWIALPAVSGVSLHYHNSGFTPAEVFKENSDINANLAEVSNQLDEDDQLALHQSIDLLGLGFRAWDGYVSLGARQIADFRMDLSPQLFKTAFGSNNSLSNFNLDEFSQELNLRTETYLGYQRAFLDDQLTLGVRGKYLFGQGHTYIERMNASIRQEGNQDPLQIETDILIRASGNTDADYGDFQDAIFSDNQGFAVDLGAHWRPNSKWQFGASLLDWGSINWQENTRSWESKGEYSFDGIEVDFSDENFQDQYQASLDSLEEELNFQEDSGATYSRSLPTRLFLSGQWNLTEKHSFGLLYHARFWEGQAYHDFGLNYSGDLTNWFRVSAGYSIINGTYGNLGLGMEFHLGPVQLYLMSDNAMAAFNYGDVRTANVRVGINVALRPKKNSGKTKSTPSKTRDEKPSKKKSEKKEKN